MDIHDDRHSLRRLCNLVHRLPATSELAAARGDVDEVDRTWTTTDYLLANVVDLLQVNNYQFALANSKHRPSKKPTPVERPRDVAAKKCARAERKDPWIGRTIYTPKEG